MRVIDIPGGERLQLAHLVLDLNGTLTDRGELIDGVGELLRALAADLEPHLLTADTFGAARDIGEQLGVAVTRVERGEDKASFVESLGADRTVAIGNGRNDALMLRTARLAIVVIGPEGAAAAALRSADILCRSVPEALRLLLDDRALIATLRP